MSNEANEKGTNVYVAQKNKKKQRVRERSSDGELLYINNNDSRRTQKVYRSMAVLMAMELMLITTLRVISSYLADNLFHFMIALHHLNECAVFRE